MDFQHLTSKERGTLRGMVRKHIISQRHLPFGGSVFWDSMGVWRDPNTDKFYPGSVRALQSFSPTLREFDLMFGVATNGPALEGAEILKSLEYPVPSAVAVTEGGGIAILAFPSDGYLMPKMLAHEQQMAKLELLEQEAKKNPLMRVLLEDTRTDDAPPMRTPYGYIEENKDLIKPTNIVLTLPPKFEVLERRLLDAKVNLSDYIQNFNPSDYVATLLNYSQEQYLDIFRRNPDLGLEEALAVLIKAQNRRIYVGPKNTGLSGSKLNKAGGAMDSSFSPFRIGGAAVLRDYPEYKPEDSIYIADKALIEKDGVLSINPSEKNMLIYDHRILIAGPHKYVNVLREHPVYEHPSGRLVPYTNLAEVSCKLGIDITLDDAPPTFVRVEGVPFLRIGTGAKAAEAISLLYDQVYKAA